MDAVRRLTGAARHAAFAAGQAAVVAHVAAHELGAAAYAIKAARAAAPADEADRAGRHECRWQRAQLPEEIRDLVTDDERLRNEICWSVFEDSHRQRHQPARSAHPATAGTPPSASGGDQNAWAGRRGWAHPIRCEPVRCGFLSEV
jgi:hypothetical protein